MRLPGPGADLPADPQRRRARGEIPLIIGDIGDVPLIQRICAEHRVGALAHFAGKIQVGESVHAPDLYFDVNLVRTLALLGALRDANIQACLFSSSAAVYGTPTEIPIPEHARKEPVNPYGATKLSVEFALAAWHGAYGLRWGRAALLQRGRGPP
ncbi:MAG: NAD-dependent epimerase/dehydratase family protein, partial [Deltaproteobacteria bacterium]|nr:NAD-dependent epimerase/dehydratase family protein [Deltaproteobacteria bacterium]